MAPESQTTAELSRPCPVCGKSEAAGFLKKENFQLLRCLNCSMTYANPVSAAMASGAYYDSAGTEYLSPAKLQSDYADVRFERELGVFRRHCPAGTVLDVGCSSGAFLFQLKKRFSNDYQILGTDVSGAPLDYAASMGVPVMGGNFLERSFSAPFDAVTFWAVMEHLFEPRLFLEKAAAVLKPGGLCFILVPNLKSLAVKTLGAKYRYIYAEHLNYFSAATLRKFVEREFAVVELKTSHFNPLVILQDFRHGPGDVPRQKRYQLLKRTTAAKKSPWMLPARLGYRAVETLLGIAGLADNLVIVGRKPPARAASNSG